MCASACTSVCVCARARAAGVTNMPKQHSIIFFMFVYVEAQRPLIKLPLPCLPALLFSAPPIRLLHLIATRLAPRRGHGPACPHAPQRTLLHGTASFGPHACACTHMWSCDVCMHPGMQNDLPHAAWPHLRAIHNSQRQRGQQQLARLDVPRRAPSQTLACKPSVRGGGGRGGGWWGGAYPSAQVEAAPHRKKGCTCVRRGGGQAPG